MKEWLATRPPSLFARDYDAWAVERNEATPDLPPATSAPSIRGALGLRWRDILKVARGETSLAKAQAQQKRRVKRESGGFVGLTGIALIRGFTHGQTDHLIETDRTFPPYAFKLHDARIWRWEDVEAHHKGEPFPKRKRGEMQGEIFHTGDIVRLCRITGRKPTEAIYKEYPDFPRPAGHVSKHPYWWRTDVETWLDERRRNEDGAAP